MGHANRVEGKNIQLIPIFMDLHGSPSAIVVLYVCLRLRPNGDVRLEASEVKM